MCPQESIYESNRSKIVEVANAMLDGRMNLIEGVRSICALRHAIDLADNEVFMPIRAIESETDHFPLGEMRAHCSTDYLQRMDEEMRQYLDDASHDILAACSKIVRIFS